MDLVAGLSALSQALGIAKQLRDFEKDFNNAEYKMRIADLYSTLADAKMALADAKEAIEAKDAEYAKLKKAFQLRESCIRVGNYLYDQQDGKSVGNPYCHRCEQIDGVMIKLVYPVGTNAHCTQCKGNFGHAPSFKRRTETAAEEPVWSA